jgi:hypothetical protein
MPSHNPRSVPCPRCNAAAGQPCRSTTRGNHHGSRVAATRNAESAADRERKLRIAREMFRP